MKIAIKPLLATLLCFLLAGCGGGSGNGNGVVNPDQDAKGVFDDYSGNLAYEGQGGEGVGGGGDGEGGIGAGGSLGQFSGVEAVVFLEDGTELGRVIVNSASGLFTIKPGRDYGGPLLIELRGRTGARYFDEAKKAYLDFGPGEVLKARVDRANRNIGVTPLTNAAAAFLDANPNVGGETLAQRIKSANERLAARLSARLPAQYKINDILKLPTLIGPSSGVGSAPDTPAGTYAVVVAALADAAASFNANLSRPAASISDDLAKDFTDGVLDERQKDGSAVAAAGQASYSLAEFDGQLDSAISRVESQFGDANNSRDTNKTILLLDESLASFSPIQAVFDDPNIAGTGPLSSTGTALSRPEGGNPGAHLETSMSLFSGDLLAVGGIKQNYSYTPTLEGAIDSVSAKADVNMISSGSSTWFVTIEQDGKRYYDLAGFDFSQGWAGASRTVLKATDFATFGESVESNPDFSATASVLKFGFVVVNRIVGEEIGNGSGPFPLNHLVDNFELTITKP